MAKKAAQSATTPKRPAKRRPVKPKPKPETSPPERVEQSSGSRLRSAGLALMVFGVGVIIGVLLAGGIRIDGGSIGLTDSLAQSHVNDRASQVRILREYAAKSFSNDSEAQKWLNDQRIAARPNDWIPFTDELGEACDKGPEAVKALADRLEVKP